MQKLILATLAMLIANSSNAAIVLTPVQVTPTSSQNVVINVYGRWDGILTPGLDALKSNDVAMYNFSVAITGATVSSLQATYAAGSSWSSITKVGGPTPFVNAATQVVRFEGANSVPIPPVNAPVPNADIGTGIGPSTLIGSISFFAPFGNYVATPTALPSTVYTTFTGFAYIGDNSGLPQNRSAHPNIAPPAAFQVFVVPEPTSTALFGLAGVGLLVRRRFKKKS